MTEESYYNSIYYVSQSKIEWKMSKKNDSGIVYKTIYNDFQSKIEWKFEWRIIYKLYTMFLSQKFEWKMK